jgi:hypothetical protein
MMAIYSLALFNRRWMPAHPVGTKVIVPLFFLLGRETAKKYFQRSK